MTNDRFTLPSHCAACGVCLMGGATIHEKTCPWYPISYYALTRDGPTKIRFILDLAAWDAGYAAGEAGEPLSSCPYPTSSRESLSWHSGFIEGERHRNPTMNR